MAKKKKKHGKIEQRKKGPFPQFKLGVLLILILLSFSGTFGIYMVTASTDPDYWQNEIASKSENSKPGSENKTFRAKKNVANPVPVSERADNSRMGECAFIGDFSQLTGYYDTKTEFVFTDSVTGMSESRMNSISRNITETKAIYIWYNYPENYQETMNALKNLIGVIQGQHNLPIYILNVIPDTDPEQSRNVDQWNSQLFAFCDAYTLHYVDINTELKNNEGTLSEDFQSKEALYTKIGELILTHVDD